MGQETTLRALWQGAAIWCRRKEQSTGDASWRALAQLYSHAASVTHLTSLDFARSMRPHIDALQAWCSHGARCHCRVVAAECEAILSLHEQYGASSFLVDDDRIIFAEEGAEPAKVVLS